ncbi:ATP-dependent zinc metalloprotease FtsH [Candidatus Villigracilis affinis]|uniref:ATP-dependent zinc metalloprotease FtsH n=1 Tax=Candidatus Villigracilis affinis TaxID=3140682 RepID=UPI002A1B6FC0|nr:ATP-dependent zinc metalloprotease FtsH [Anaerolineales bacterium]
MKQSVNQLLNFFKNHKYGKPSLILLIIGLVAVGTMSIRSMMQEEPIALSNVAAAISAGRVVRIEELQGSDTLIIHYKDGTEDTTRRDQSTSFLEQMQFLGVSKSQMAKLEYEVVQSKMAASDKIISTVISIAMLGMMGFAVTRMGGGIIGRKKFVEGAIPNLSFNDVAGMDENREELVDIVAFLKNNQLYERIGARMPHGVLLAGDPGTGKTLLAKAIAGEAGVPFFSTSGSEFVEMFVGMGASRVRSLFKKARAKAPCIIFIDEIDAVGRKRHGGGGGGGEMEQDQTLNQLLVEMDGFAATDGVVVLAATNRVDVLDPALIRAGRFDRHVTISRPDVKGRVSILEVHVKDRKLAADVNLMDIAKSTPGLVGADLANIVNEAAIIAVRGGNEVISVLDFQEAVEKSLIGGVQQKSRIISESERRTIAYHEAGHAVVMHATPHSDPVYKITIIPRGQSGGFTMALPEQDSILMFRNQIMARIIGLMGGRVAEEIFCHDITSGASNDLQVATQLAEDMVMRLGMSISGLRVFQRHEVGGSQAGQKTFEALDKAINEILDESYQEAKRIVTEKRDAVERVTQALLAQETLSREEFVALM